MVPLAVSREFIDQQNQVVVTEIARIIREGAYGLAFDQDGTVAFTEGHQFRGFAGLVTKHTGVELDYRLVAQEMLGKTETDIVSELQEQHGIKGDLFSLVEQRGQLYFDSVVGSALKPHPSVVEICKIQNQTGHHKPIVVSNGRQGIQSDLLSHWGIRNLFGEIHTSDTMRPDLPLKERKRAFIRDLPDYFGLDASRVIVFEDSRHMAVFAEERGMGVVYVHHALNKPFMPRSGLVLRCDSLIDGLRL